MSRRTITNLSRELNVSRPKIYRAIGKLGIVQKAGGEYPLDEWELLKKELASTSDHNKEKRVDARKVDKASSAGITKAQLRINSSAKLRDMDTSTIQERLDNAKQEYDYNRQLIITFQEEADAYVSKNNNTTIRTHNGTVAPIPSIANLEKYIKLNISLSKLITELEGDLDLSVEGGDDPFA